MGIFCRINVRKRKRNSVGQKARKSHLETKKFHLSRQDGGGKSPSDDIVTRYSI